MHRKLCLFVRFSRKTQLTKIVTISYRFTRLTLYIINTLTSTFVFFIILIGRQVIVSKAIKY